MYEEKTYIIRSKIKNELIGYLYFEGLDGSSPEMTMQFDKTKITENFDFSLICELLNMVNKEMGVRAIMVHVNSDIERDLFDFLGYGKVENEVMLALPI